MTLMCALCKVQQCMLEPGTKDPPGYCAMASKEDEVINILEQAEASYMTEGETRDLALASARTEAEGYLRWPRVQEVMEFAWKLDARHLGIAHCIGLIDESRRLHKILEHNGFQVSSVCCKVGTISKLDIGLKPDETLAPDGGVDPMCNPVGQAELLNNAQTDLNILVGLCVGHDSLFIRNSNALVTVLVAKDRVTGHNPAAALYTSHSYYERLDHIHEKEKQL
jgi:uncharacterized metal-binding protein